MKQCLGRCYCYNFLFVILSLHADGHARVRQRWSANFVESQILELHLEREWIVWGACIAVEIFLDALFAWLMAQLFAPFHNAATFGQQNNVHIGRNVSQQIVVQTLLIQNEYGPCIICARRMQQMLIARALDPATCVNDDSWTLGCTESRRVNLANVRLFKLCQIVLTALIGVHWLQCHLGHFGDNWVVEHTVTTRRLVAKVIDKWCSLCKSLFNAGGAFN